MGNVSTTDQLSDPRWRLSNLYYITDKRGHRVPFRPNQAQLKFLGDTHSANIILKARQLGFTTLCCLIYLDACIWSPNTRAGIIAHKLDDAKVIFRDKIRFPYDQLPDELKAAIPAVQDSADTLTFGNNSSIRVSTSMRSGTLQYLHVSEFGKICAQYPEKAREIVTGALNTVQTGQFIVIESTADGQEGAFYKMTQEARALADSGRKLTELDYKFHFFPWHDDADYTLKDAYVAIGDDELNYFDRLAADGIALTKDQKSWYVKKQLQMEGDMEREFPSTPDEAFAQALEGAYFSRQLSVANKQQRIGGFPVDPRFKVNTFWDLGRNDLNAIWLHQFVKGFHRFVGYYENSGEFIGHYVNWLDAWAADNDVAFSSHYLPHDGDRQSQFLEGGTLAVMEKLKFRPEIVPRPANKVEAISTSRSIFPKCQFDEVGCSLGLRRLRMYRKQWDENRGVWRDTPRHDDASHGADAFSTFACSPVNELEDLAKRTPIDRHRGNLYRNKSSSSWKVA
jgi:hypothetical protein